MSAQDRDDANLKQFKSRSQQPKLLVAGATNGVSSMSTPTPVTVNIIFDQGFGSISDQIDDTRFNYVGTSPAMTQYEGMCSRKTGQNCMRSGFTW